tara:strand:+ start:2277 stop:2669 length:393 start_codon:yes stop_codon:yes gene_type:complete
MKSLSKIIISFLLSISIIFFNSQDKVLAISDVDWLLLKENNDGKEWIDLGSLKKITDNEISVLTRFFKVTDPVKDEGVTSLYVMRINCDNKQFKDTAINGIPNFKAKWKSSNNDELIDVVIEKSCSQISS